MMAVAATTPMDAIGKPTRALDVLRRTLASAGWKIEYVDLDLTKAAPTAAIRLDREDGRWLWARVDTLGRCTMETFHREIALGVPGNYRGRHARFPLIDDVFLGRTRHEGPRALLRHLIRYLADNALRPVSLPELRAAWAGVMAAPTKSDGGRLERASAGRLESTLSPSARREEKSR